MWHRAADKEEDPELGNWEKVVVITQKYFREGGTCGVMHLEDDVDNTQGGRHRPTVFWPGGGSVENDIRNHQLLVIVFHSVS